MATLLRLELRGGLLYTAVLNLISRAVRTVVSRESPLGQRLQRISRKVRPTPVTKTQALLKALSAGGRTIRFIQIGANDGVIHDPLHEFIVAYRWHGILVEPLRHIFERLRNTYAGRDGLIFENAAIAAQAGTRDFYYVSETPGPGELPEWYTCLGSLSKEVVLSHAQEFPAIAGRVVAESVSCLSFDELCRKHRVGDVDVIAIDTEGHDFEILEMIDFERYRPVILLYEHHHMTPSRKVACRERLSRYGYDFQDDMLNTICFRHEAPERYPASMRTLWNELRPFPWAPFQL